MFFLVKNRITKEQMWINYLSRVVDVVRFKNIITSNHHAARCVLLPVSAAADVDV